MKKIFFPLVAFTIFSPSLFAQYITVAQYIDEYKEVAIREMKRMGVPAAITLAQGILETENGNSDLVKKSNNHFGIKCKSSWTGGGVSHDDDAMGECFRVYKDAEESYRDHSNFLRGSVRYASLFDLDPRDYKAWARGLRKAGYATNPRYPDILIKNIEDNKLQQYTLLAAGEVPVFDASKYTDDKDNPIIKDEPDSVEKDGEDVENPSLPRNLTINGSKALFVIKGTSLLAIATQHNINLAKLLEINELKKDGLLEKDQIIFLEKKQKEGDHDYHVLKESENIYDVAQN
ncbi:MAG: glucosaminidase domain-containing protein, partial [Panacibacter sp.]